jgi:hypothetical protein
MFRALALALAFLFAAAAPAPAWHLVGKRACLRHAIAPECGPDAVAVCKARRVCAVEPHRTIEVCAEWRCRARR